MEDVVEQQNPSLGEDGESDIVTEQATFVHGAPHQNDNGPPKVDAEVEVLHEKVTKQIIKEGHGEKPSKYSTCFVHYRAWTGSTQHKFEDTWQEQRPIELILGKGNAQNLLYFVVSLVPDMLDAGFANCDSFGCLRLISITQIELHNVTIDLVDRHPIHKKEMEGLGIGISNMKSGERALLHVGWELGYGKEGSFSFPNVPPMADIIYEVELIGFDETKEDKPRSDMTVEERIGAADRRRMDGNALFKEVKLEEAMQQYEMAIAYMGDDFMFQLFGKYRDMAMAVKNPCHLNMAACYIKLKQYDDAIVQCSIVLAEDENNVKALYRRGKARAELGQTEAAREDLLKARKYAPDDKAIARELRVLAEHEKSVYQKQKEMYKGMLGPRPEPKLQQTSWLALFWQWLISLFYKIFKQKTQKSD